jgi:hypothetical protein
MEAEASLGSLLRPHFTRKTGMGKLGRHPQPQQV